MIRKQSEIKKNRKEIKKEFLKALKKYEGCIAAASKEVGISRMTVYNWMKEDEKFEKEVYQIKEECDEKMREFAEQLLYQKIKEGDKTCLIFFLKTRHPKFSVKHEIRGHLTYEKAPDEIELDI